MSENIDDIVREMRNKAYQADSIFCGNVDSSFVRVFADRIEAAVKTMRADIEHLRAALRPVLECNVCADTDEEEAAHRCMIAVVDSLSIYGREVK